MNKVILAMAICLGLTACGGNGTKKEYRKSGAIAAARNKGLRGSFVFPWQAALCDLYGNRKKHQRSHRSAICR